MSPVAVMNGSERNPSPNQYINISIINCEVLKLESLVYCTFKMEYEYMYNYTTVRKKAQSTRTVQLYIALHIHCRIHTVLA